jgi:hypothetical protein
VLNEEAPQASINWELAAVGQSCTDFCGSKQQICSEDALKTLQGPESLSSQVEDEFVCNAPLLSGCGPDGGSYDPAKMYCYYTDNTCEAQDREASRVNCDSKTEDTARFCACSTDSMSSGTVRAVGLLSGLMVLPLLNTRLTVMLLALLALVSGHNWINSNSRSPHSASTFPPCKPSQSGLPHVQVGPNQPFQIEWMNGHGDYAFFAIQHSKDADKLILNTLKVLNDYVDSAPEWAHNTSTGRFQRFHRSDMPGLDNMNTFTGVNMANYFASVLTEEDPLFLPRPTSFGGGIGDIDEPDEEDTIYFKSYKDIDRADDRRVSYRNENYPWLEAVYKFKVTSLAAFRPDTTNFYIPGYAGYGTKLTVTLLILRTIHCSILLERIQRLH